MDPEVLKAEGWRCRTGKGFDAAAGPYWMRGWGPEREAGLLVEEKHTNNAGKMHGGALMTFTDIALGSGAADALGHKNCVTVQLNIQFVSGPRVGEFIMCRPEVVRRSSELVFMRGLITTAERTIASVEGIWKAFQAG
jgi:uncharacterized protein (TIGR00369 family)